MQWENESHVKLYRREAGSFALLPLYARALAGELLKFVDDDGRIFLGTREPWAAIARLCGATAGDRRLLRSHVVALLDDGYLTVVGSHLVIRNFARAQREPSSTATRTELDGDANEDRTGREPDANESRTSRERTTKTEPSARTLVDDDRQGPPSRVRSASDLGSASGEDRIQSQNNNNSGGGEASSVPAHGYSAKPAPRRVAGPAAGHPAGVQVGDSVRRRGSHQPLPTAAQGASPALVPSTPDAAAILTRLTSHPTLHAVANAAFADLIAGDLQPGTKPLSCALESIDAAAKIAANYLALNQKEKTQDELATLVRGFATRPKPEPRAGGGRGRSAPLQGGPSCLVESLAQPPPPQTEALV